MATSLNSLLANGKNNVTARSNMLAAAQTRLQNTNSASNMQTVTTPTLTRPDISRPATNLNLQKAQQPVQTRLDNLNNQTFNANSGAGTVAPTIQTPEQSRFIGFQQPQAKSFDKMMSGGYMYIPTNVQTAETENRKEEERYRTGVDAINDFQVDVFKHNGKWDEGWVRDHYPEFKDNLPAAKELWNELWDRGAGEDPNVIAQYYPELLQAKNTKDLEEVKKQSEENDKRFQFLDTITNKVLKSNWDTLSANGMKYVEDAKLLRDTVDYAKKKGVVGGANDYEILQSLAKNNPELTKAIREMSSLELTDSDRAKLGLKDSNLFQRIKAATEEFIRDKGELYSDEEASYEEIETGIRAKEKLESEFGHQTWMKLATEIGVPLDSLEKFAYRSYKEWENLLLEKGSEYTKDYLTKKIKSEFNLSDEQANSVRNVFDTASNPYIEERVKTNKQQVLDYQDIVNKEYERRKRENLDEDIENFYNNRSMTNMLLNGDGRGFIYKSTGEAAQNADNLLMIAGGIVAPEIVLPAMFLDSYARESQEAFEELIEVQKKNGVEGVDAYDNAQKGAAMVGLASSLIEVGLESVLGGVETTASKAFHDILTKDFTEKATKMVAEKGLMELLKQGAVTQFKASLEEGLEEVFQQAIHNKALQEYDPDQKITEGMLEAFEGGFYNWMNLLAGGGDVLNNFNANKDTIGANIGANLGTTARDTVDTVKNAVDTVKNTVTPSQNRQNVLQNVKNQVTTQTENNTQNTAVENGTTDIDNSVENNQTTEKQGIIDKITDKGAEFITKTVSAQDKLYKAQEPRMNVLSNKKNLERRRRNSDRANELILENGYKPTNTAERLDAHQKTLNTLWKQVKTQVNSLAGKKVDQTSIITALKDYIAEKKALNIAAIEPDIKALEKELASFEKSQKQGKTDLPVLENKKQVYNDIIDWKEQEASEVYKGGLRLITAEIGKIEDGLIAEIPGEFSALKKDVGALLDTYEDVFKADMKNQRSKGAGLAEAYSRIEGVGDIIEGAVGIFKGEGGKVLKGVGKVLLGKSLAKAKNVDFLVKSGFEELSKTVKPKNNNTNVEDTTTTPTIPTAPTNNGGENTVVNNNKNENTENNKESDIDNDTTPPAGPTPPDNGGGDNTTEKNKVTKKKATKKNEVTSKSVDKKGTNVYNTEDKGSPLQPLVSSQQGDESTRKTSFFATRKNEKGKDVLERIKGGEKQVIESKAKNKDMFTNKEEFDYNSGWDGYFNELNNVIYGDKDVGTIGSVDIRGELKPVVIDDNSFTHIFEKHGEFNKKNLIATVNNPDYKIIDVKTLDKQGAKPGQPAEFKPVKDKINLVKELPSKNGFLVVGANYNAKKGYYVATHFEIVYEKGNELSEHLSKGTPLDEKTAKYVEEHPYTEQPKNVVTEKANVTEKKQETKTNAKNKVTNPTKSKETSLFNESEIEKGNESEGLNPDALPLQDYKEMQRLENGRYNSLGNALRHESLGTYMATKIATDLVGDYNEIIEDERDPDNLEDRWVSIQSDIEEMYEMYEDYLEKKAESPEEAKLALESADDLANNVIKGKTAKELIDQYKSDYETDLKIYKRLLEKYPNFYNGKINLNGDYNKALREFAGLENETAQDIDYQEVAEAENETAQIPTIFEEDLQDMNLRELEENETAQMVEEEMNKVTKKESKPKNLVTSKVEESNNTEQSEFETLPDDVTVSQEAKQLGAKRIAPDRVPRQQLTFEEGVNKIAENLETLAEYKKARDEIYSPEGYNDGEVYIRYNNLKKEFQNIMYGNNGFQFKSNKSKEFTDLWKNIVDNKDNKTALREVAKNFYISKVKKDISRGYVYPQEVLDKIPGAKKAINNRERYEKGLNTSFSAKDERIDYSEKDKIGAGIKSQDGKQVTKEQKEDIVKGVEDFGRTLGLDMKKFAEDRGLVYVHLHGGSAFLKSAAGLYRESTNAEGEKNISVSVGGMENVRHKNKRTGEWETDTLNTTMSHELGHAMDYLVDNKLFSWTQKSILGSKYNPVNRLRNYYARGNEIVARAIEQYVAVENGQPDYYLENGNLDAGDLKGTDLEYALKEVGSYYERPGYWSKPDYEKYVKPYVEEAFRNNFEEYKINKSQKDTKANSKNTLTASNLNKVTNR